MPDSRDYTEEYYKTLNYVDYLNRGDRYKHTAKELVELLEKLNLLNKYSDSILDYGSGVGFFVKGLLCAGCEDVSGYDISEWASEQARNSRCISLFKLPANHYDLVFALDVFEHMHDADIAKVINDTTPNVMVVRIPSSTDGGKTFHLDVSRRDPTHVNCKDKSSWIKFFRDLGYFSVRLNMFSIYDSDGVTCLLLIKD